MVSLYTILAAIDACKLETFWMETEGKYYV